MLYILIAVAWCVLASFALAICRVSALSDDAHTLELAECLLVTRVRERVQLEEGSRTADDGEAWRATG